MINGEGLNGKYKEVSAMKKLIALGLVFVCVFSLISCGQQAQGQQEATTPTQSSNDETTPTQSSKSDDEFHAHVPYEAMLNLKVIGGKFRFQRIATTPCIVYSNAPISDMSKGMIYNDNHDILTSIFQATDGKDAIMDTPECEFSRYIYMFDNERENIPWHYRFAICNCGAVMITNNDELICTIQLTEEELRSIIPADLELEF